ncbi:MAG: cytochrome C oxidase assembly protein [Pseudomonadota bacterium]
MSGHREHEIFKRRRARNLAVLALLGGFVVLLFTVTIVRMGENARSPFTEFWNPSYSDGEVAR